MKKSNKVFHSNQKIREQYKQTIFRSQLYKLVELNKKIEIIILKICNDKKNLVKIASKRKYLKQSILM